MRAVVFFVILSLVGCTPPSTLKPERIAEIKKVGIVTRIGDNEVTVLDHTTAMKKSYTGGQFGALGALLESGINLGIRQYRYSKSITGSTDTVKPFVPYSTVKGKIDMALSQRLSTKYAAVEPGYFDVKKLSDSKSDCLVEAKKTGIDTLVFLDIAYGLAAYDSELASLSVDADMIIYDVSTEDVLLKRRIESDQQFKEHRMVQELAEHDGRIFKADFAAAIEGFSVYVARHMGVPQ